MKLLQIPLLLLVFVGLGQSGTNWAGPPDQEAQAAQRTDAQGDPLPAEARARIGSLRLQTVGAVYFSPDGKLLACPDIYNEANAITLWAYASGKEVRRLYSTQGRVYGIAFSPDGRLVAATGNAPAIQLWEIATGKPLSQLENLPVFPRGIVFAPDGKTVAGIGNNSTIHLWDVESGKQIRTFAVPQIFSESEGGRFARQIVRWVDRAVTRVSQRQCQLAATQLTPHSISFAADGKTLALWGSLIYTLQGQAHNPIQVCQWDVASGKETCRWNVASGLNSVGYFAPDGRKIAVMERNMGGSVQLFDVATGKKLASCKVPAGQPNLGGLVFFADGTHLVTSTNEGICVSEVATGKVVREWALPQEDKFVVTSGLAISPDSKVLLESHYQGLRHWDLGTGKAIKRDKAPSIYAGFFSPDSKAFLATGADGQLKAWDVQNGRQRPHFAAKEATDEKTAKHRVTSAAISADGVLLAKSLDRGNDGQIPEEPVQIWNLQTGKKIRAFGADSEEGFNGFNSLIFSPNGHHLAAGNQEGSVVLWKLSNGRALHTYKIMYREMKDDKGQVLGSTAIGPEPVFSRDGKTLAALAWDLDKPENESMVLCLWEVATGKERARIALPKGHFPGNPALVNTVQFMPDQRTVALGSGNSVHLFDLATRQEISRFGGFGVYADSLAVSADGRYLVAPSAIGTFRIWEMSTGKLLGQFGNHRSRVWVTFAPDGKTLASGGFEGNALLWNLEQLVSRQRPAARPLTPRDLDELVWKDLLGHDEEKAFAAQQTLAVAKETVPFLRKHLQPAQAGNLERLPQLLADLHSADFLTWWSAGRELEKLGNKAYEPLSKEISKAYEASDRNGEPIGLAQQELAARCQWLMEKTSAIHFPPARVQMLRAVEVLEMIDTAEARDLLAALAAGAPGAQLTVYSEAALKRLTIRPPAGQKQALDSRQLAALWSDLAGDDAGKAYSAIHALAEAPGQIIPYLRERLQPAPPPDVRSIQQRIDELKSNSFNVRQRASADLEKHGEAAEPLLRKAVEAKPTLDVRQRLDEILDKIELHVLPPEILRADRAIEVLERIGTPEAREVLESLAKGTPEVRMTREAKAALERLAQYQVILRKQP
jgi:WD40 repeat protein